MKKNIKSYSDLISMMKILHSQNLKAEMEDFWDSSIVGKIRGKCARAIFHGLSSVGLTQKIGELIDKPQFLKNLLSISHVGSLEAIYSLSELRLHQEIGKLWAHSQFQEKIISDCSIGEILELISIFHKSGIVKKIVPLFENPLIIQKFLEAPKCHLERVFELLNSLGFHQHVQKMWARVKVQEEFFSYELMQELFKAGLKTKALEIWASYKPEPIENFIFENSLDLGRIVKALINMDLRSEVTRLLEICVRYNGRGSIKAFMESISVLHSLGFQDEIERLLSRPDFLFIEKAEEAEKNERRPFPLLHHRELVKSFQSPELRKYFSIMWGRSKLKNEIKGKFGLRSLLKKLVKLDLREELIALLKTSECINKLIGSADGLIPVVSILASFPESIGLLLADTKLQKKITKATGLVCLIRELHRLNLKDQIKEILAASVIQNYLYKNDKNLEVVSDTLKELAVFYEMKDLLKKPMKDEKSIPAAGTSNISGGGKTSRKRGRAPEGSDQETDGARKEQKPEDNDAQLGGGGGGGGSGSLGRRMGAGLATVFGPQAGGDFGPFGDIFLGDGEPHDDFLLAGAGAAGGGSSSMGGMGGGAGSVATVFASQAQTLQRGRLFDPLDFIGDFEWDEEGELSHLGEGGEY
jgi:hypothetical protein